MSKNFLEVKNVDFIVGGQTKVKNVSFCIQNEGDVICLLGPSGIGKTTILRTIAGLEKVNNGSIIINNKIVCKFDDSIIVDDLLQKVKLNNLDTCLENSDYIIVACPLNKNTKYLLNKEKILKSKKGVYIINISRGGIINENDVNELQENEFINGIAFDVLKTVDMVSSDMSWSTGGMCGKKQWIPVGMGGPAIKCQVNIGGR